MSDEERKVMRDVVWDEIGLIKVIIMRSPDDEDHAEIMASLKRIWDAVGGDDKKEE
jgi:hypothetical protein